MSIRSKARLLLDTIELRAGSIITSEEVRALKHRWRWRYAQRMSVNIEQEIFDVFEDFGPFQIDKVLTDSGLAWWRANLLRKDGTLRNNAWTQGQSLHVEGGDQPTTKGMLVLSVLYNFERFELSDWHVDHNSFGEPVVSFPIFTMRGAGSQFTYIARPWQSGGRTELV